MKKSEFIAVAAEKAGLTKKDMEKAMDAMFESIGDVLAAGDKLLVISDKDEDLKSSLEKMGITQYMWDRRS